ncbi:hypothetical protein AAGQ96_09765 [Pantoea sp. MBD-2R]|uniref:hypothetical protein n=1 Tax=Pantoea sp. MBD-2R TaxID=3141540 RepID=UPI0031838DB6
MPIRIACSSASTKAAEPKVLTQLRQACKKLSARKQRQIAEFIQVITTPQKRSLPPGTGEWQAMHRSN